MDDLAVQRLYHPKTSDSFQTSSFRKDETVTDTHESRSILEQWNAPES